MPKVDTTELAYCILKAKLQASIKKSFELCIFFLMQLV